jgi:hypothetical protein
MTMMKKFALFRLVAVLSLCCLAAFGLAGGTPLNVEYGTVHSLSRPVIPDLVKTRAQKDQLSPQSLSYTVDEKGLGFTYLFDGNDSLAGIAIHGWSLTPNLSLNAIAVTNPTDTASLYTGTMLTYRVFSQTGFSLSLGAGVKGFDLLNGFTAPKRQFVFGVQGTVAFRT